MITADERLARAIALLRTSLGTKLETPVTPAKDEPTTMNTTYTRLNNGAWGLRANGTLTPGQQVQVTTRDGRVKTETVGTIVWANNGVTVASTARADAQNEAPVRVITPRETPAPVAPRVEPVRAQTPAPSAPVTPDALDQIIRDLETALAGLKSLRRAA